MHNKNKIHFIDGRLLKCRIIMIFKFNLDNRK